MSKFSLNIKTLFTLVLMALLSACQTVSDPVPQAEPFQAPQPSAEAKLPQVVEAKPDPDKILYQQAISAAIKGKNESAIRQFTQLVTLNPEYEKAYTNLGLVLLQNQQQQKAKQAFLKAIKQDKSDAIAYNHLAIIQRNEGLFKPAMENYTKAIDADPNYANAYLNLGILLDIYIQDLPKALKQYQIFQKLTDNKNEQVEKWVLDIKRRIEAKNKKSNG